MNSPAEVTQRPTGTGLATPVQYVKGVGPRYALLLQKLGIQTVEDLLSHFPLRWEDRRHFAPLGRVQHLETVCSSGTVVGAVAERTPRRGMALVRVVIQDATGRAELVYFNQPWLERRFNQLKGSPICVFGQASRSSGLLTFQSPEWEELTTDEHALHVNRIVPIHPATEGLTPKQIRGMVWNALEKFGRYVRETLPVSLRQRLQLAHAAEALRQIHFPDSQEALERARHRLVFEELFLLQMALAMRKQALGPQLPGIPMEIGPEVPDRLRQALPFPLTRAQERVIGEVYADMRRDHPMNRLLQGDVGSGKTVVAAAAALATVAAGYQAALMAPTEILAEQHARVLADLLAPMGVTVRRLVGSTRVKGKRLIYEEMRTGVPALFLGTHALIQEAVEFANLGLAIIDEQHRFGVLQRLTLIDKGAGERAPHVLVMTATPIPRSLALTIYGDLDVSIIDEMPPGRKRVVTHWKPKDQRERTYAGVRSLVRQGRQVYFLCPLVEESEKLQAQAATELARRLQDKVFPDLRVGLVHGQMKSHEKDEVMDRFRAGEIDVLVATVVIEVGVDVPNACCMVIEDAERFGLAQLHQLRGRVGRGSEQSFCVLLADPTTEEGRQRLTAMIRLHDGFQIAEQDLRLRGPGEFYGTQQSGFPPLRIANIVGDQQILEVARREAFALVAEDPDLAGAEHVPLWELIHRKFVGLLLASVG
ncbi:MAG: ATP-dependent DNA helicase RecG [Armatimonadetes bacterium]|nr:ATP-dependent DNA helicase RecG [Armatimonadota bacterium]